MKRNTKKRMRKQKKYQIRRDVKKQRAEHVVDCLDLPKDLVMWAGRHRIRITGRCLAMAYFAAEEVKVTGCITSICYEE